jgi:hypothetical protein
LVAVIYLSLSSSPQVVSGDPSEQIQDGFPINNVGNDRANSR